MGRHNFHALGVDCAMLISVNGSWRSLLIIIGINAVHAFLSKVVEAKEYKECKYTYNIGEMVRLELRNQGRTVVWLASQIPCTTNNLHKILRKHSIDIELLWRISTILGHNFFQDLR